MIAERLPIFTKGNLLTEDMLESLKTYSYTYAQLSYKGYANGIISGCSIHITNDTIQIEPGIVCFNSKLYLLANDMYLKTKVTEHTIAAKLRFGDEIITNDFLYREVELIYSDNLQETSDTLELFRYHLHSGAQLRDHYQNLKDFNTEHDTLNIIDSAWSSYEASTLSPVILYEFLEEAEKSPLDNPMDYNFCSSIAQLSGTTINRKAIIFYIRKRLGLSQTSFTNGELYSYLLEALDAIKNDKGGMTQKKTERRHHVIMS